MRSWIWLIVAVLLVLGVRYLYFKPQLMIGADVPQFEAIGKDGKSVHSSSWEGQYVLYDFWGSWCGPCRQENKNLVKIYDEFGGSDKFRIVSISIETETEPWEKAIVQDQLIWPDHIVQTDRFQSPLAQLFGIREIPTSYLANPDGKIVGVNMTYPEMKSFLAEKI